MRRPPLASSLLILASLALVAPIARPADPEPVDPEGRSLGSVFFVAKSENRNEVHYGFALDAACSPAGPAPVFAYWRMRERGPLARSRCSRVRCPPTASRSRSGSSEGSEAAASSSA